MGRPPSFALASKGEQLHTCYTHAAAAHMHTCCSRTHAIHMLRPHTHRHKFPCIYSDILHAYVRLYPCMQAADATLISIHTTPPSMPRHPWIMPLQMTQTCVALTVPTYISVGMSITYVYAHMCVYMSHHIFITEIPPHLGVLTNLRLLDLSDNEISTIPSEMRHCVALKVTMPA